MPLENLKILLTGANPGIGAALTKTLAHAGAHVPILARDEAKLGRSGFPDHSWQEEWQKFRTPAPGK